MNIRPLIRQIRQFPFPFVFLLAILLGLAVRNNPVRWWVGMLFFLACSALAFGAARQSWKERRAEAAYRLDHTYDFLTWCFALACGLAIIAIGITHRGRISPAPVWVAAVVLFTVFFAIAVPMRIKLESEKKKRRRRASGG